MGVHRDSHRAEISTLQEKAKNAASVVRKEEKGRCQRSKSEIIEMSVETCTLQSSGRKESELVEQSELCAVAHKHEALNTLTVQDFVVSKHRHLQNRKWDLCRSAFLHMNRTLKWNLRD